MRVLLAEDDMRLGKLIQYMLEQNDIDVEWVTDGNDIYSYATYAEYDIEATDHTHYESAVEPAKQSK